MEFDQDFLRASLKKEKRVPNTYTLSGNLVEELKRNRELLRQYQQQGPKAARAAATITQDIQAAEKALAGGNIIDIFKAYDSISQNG